MGGGMKIQKLVPLSEHKGPILKLTEKDNEKIADIQKKIIEHDQEIYNCKKYFNNKRRMSYSERDYLHDRIESLEIAINNLLEEIRQIKISRFQKQQRLYNKKHLDIQG